MEIMWSSRMNRDLLQEFKTKRAALLNCFWSQKLLNTTGGPAQGNFFKNRFNALSYCYFTVNVSNLDCPREALRYYYFCKKTGEPQLVTVLKKMFLLLSE